MSTGGPKKNKGGSNFKKNYSKNEKFFYCIQYSEYYSF